MTRQAGLWLLVVDSERACKTELDNSEAAEYRIEAVGVDDAD